MMCRDISFRGISVSTFSFGKFKFVAVYNVILILVIVLVMLMFISFDVSAEDIQGYGCSYNYTRTGSLNVLQPQMSYVSNVNYNYPYTSYLFTVADIILFSYFDDTYFRVYDSNGNLIWANDEQPLNKGQYVHLVVNPGVYRIISTKKFTVLTGDPITRTVVGYYAVDENGRGISTEFYTWIPSHAWAGEKLIIFAYNNNTHVNVTYASNGTKIWSGVLNDGQHHEIVGLYSCCVHITSDKPVSVLTYFDQGYFVPASTGMWTGTKFYTYVGTVGGWFQDLTVYAFNDETHVKIIDTDTGKVIWSGTLNNGDVHVETFINTEKYLTILSDKNVTVSVQPWRSYTCCYHQGAYVPSSDGRLIGTDFLATTLSGGYLYILAYKYDTKVYIYDSNGHMVGSYVLNAGDYVNANPGHGLWRIKSTKPIAIYSGYGEWNADFAPVAYSEELPYSLKVYLSIQLDETNKILHISALAHSKIYGIVKTGMGYYKILDANGNVVKSGGLCLDETAGLWVSDVDVSQLRPGIYNVNVTIVSSFGERGSAETTFKIPENVNGVVYGIVINGYTNQVVSGVTVSLYDYLSYLLKGTPIMQTVTTSDGRFTFNNVPPGYYVIKAVKGNLAGCSDIIVVHRGEVVQVSQIILWSNENAAQLIAEMEKLHNSLEDLMDHETDIIGTVSSRFPQDIQYDFNVWWQIVDFVGDVISGEEVLDVVLKAHELTEKAVFYKLLWKAIRASMKEELKETIKKDLPKETLELILSYEYPIKPEFIKKSNFYTSISSRLDDLHTEFVSKSPNIKLSNDFDVDKAKEIIRSQITQIDQVENGCELILSPNSDPKVFPLRSAIGLYNLSAAFMHLLGFTHKVLTCVQLTSAGVAIALAPTGVGGGTAATIAAGASIAKTAVSLAETMAKVSTAIAGSMAGVVWESEMLTIPTIYNDTMNFILSEASHPYYLSKSHTFAVTADADLIGALNINGRYVVIGNPLNLISPIHIPFKPWLGHIGVSVKNIGDTSKVTVVAESYWDYRIPPILDTIMGGIKRIPLTETLIYKTFTLANSQSTCIDIPCMGFYINSLDMLNPHVINVKVFSGPFLNYYTQFYYYVIDPDKNGYVNAVANGRMVRVNDLAMYLPNETLLISTNLTPENPTCNATFTVSEDTYSVEIHMFAPSTAIVELHVYDSENRHVGYNVETGIYEKEFPVEVHRFNDMTVVEIPNASGKTYRVQVKLISPSYSATPVRVYLLQIPKRPAILGVSTRCINVTVGKDRYVSITLQLAEIGGQNPIYDLTASISDIRNGSYTLPLVSSRNIVIDTLPAGASTNVSYRIYIPLDVPDGIYTGTITLVCNAGTYNVDVNVRVESLPDLSITPVVDNMIVNVSRISTLSIPVIAINRGFSNVSDVEIVMIINNTTVDVTHISLNASIEKIVEFEWRPNATGVYNMTFVIDPNDTIYEFNESNNVASMIVTVNVVELPPLPGHTKPPKDLDGDGVLEDFNGNGRLDFDDVVKLYKYMEWIRQNYPLSKVDQNGDGKLDFNDVVKLFERI